MRLILQNDVDARIEEGIILGEGTNLTIYAQPTNAGGVEGRLTIYGSTYGFGSGIGSDRGGSCGDITINGGTTTVSSNYGAGIGAGYEGSCGDITINGGIVTATGGQYWPIGIGASIAGKGGNITIDGTPAIKAGENSERAQIVSQYEGQRYVNVTYTPSVVPINPGEHNHGGIPQSGFTPAGKNVEFFECSCGKLFEDKDCTIEITDLNAWLAKQDSDEPAPISDKEKSAEGKTKDTKAADAKTAANTGITADNTDLPIILGFIVLAVAGLAVVFMRRRIDQ